MTTESNIWKWLKKGICDHYYLERVENSVGAGFPDVWGYRRGANAFFIELKQVKKPVKETSNLNIRLEPSQHVWHDRQIRYKNKRCWFLVYVDRERFLVPGCFHIDLREMTHEKIKLFDVSHLNQVQLLDKACNTYA